MSTYIDSRDEAVEADYNSYTITCPTSFLQGNTYVAGRVKEYVGSIQTTGATSPILLTIPFTTNGVSTLVANLTSYCSLGTNVGTGTAQQLTNKITSFGGVVTSTNFINNFSNAYTTSFGANVVGNTITMQVTGIAANTINWTVVVRVYSS